MRLDEGNPDADRERKRPRQLPRGSTKEGGGCGKVKIQGVGAEIEGGGGISLRERGEK